MTRVQNKLGLAIIGALLLMVVAALAGVVYGGPLDPPGTPASTQENLIFQPANGCAGFPMFLNPGSYKLAQNITVPNSCAQFGIVTGDNVSLDLAGFILQGGTGTKTGISVGNNSSVHDGVVTGFAELGILVFGTSVRIENLSITHNGSYGLFIENGIPTQQHAAVVNNVTSSFNGSYGIEIDSIGSVLTNCTANNNGYTGIQISGGTVTNCNASENNGTGFSISNSTLSGCTANSNIGLNGYGIVGTGGVVTDCEVAFNAQDGINTTASSSVQGCNVHQNSGDGIENINTITLNNNVYNNTGAGIRAAASGNRIDSNNVVSNSGGGIVVSGTTNTIIRNSVTGGTPYTIGAGNTSGPISAPGVIPTNPFGNITY